MRGPSSTTVRWDLVRDGFISDMVHGDERSAHLRVARLVGRGVPARQVLMQLFAPAALAVGDRWADGSLSVAEEHRASEIMSRLLGEVRPRAPGRRRGTAVVATVRDEHHTLPTAMAAIALREDRWIVEHLGSGVPTVDLTRFVGGCGAEVVVLSVTMRENIGPTEALARELEGAGVQALVGGPGRTLDELCQLASDAVRPPGAPGPRP